MTSEARPLAEFPTPGELWSLYEKGMDFKRTDEAAKPLVTPYAASGEQSRRYYQDAAIRAVFEKTPRREELIAHLPESGTSAEKVRLVSRMEDYNLYDVPAQLAYSAPARTRPAPGSTASKPSLPRMPTGSPPSATRPRPSCSRW